MKSRITFTSASAPQNVWFVFGWIASDRPVPGGSMNTMSVVAIRLSGLSTSGKFGQFVISGSGVATRVGANEPSRSHTDDEPGPRCRRT